jgi:hypothetical protein
MTLKRFGAVFVMVAAISFVCVAQTGTKSGTGTSGTGTTGTGGGTSPTGGAPTSPTSPATGGTQPQSNATAPAQSATATPPSVFFESQSLAYGGVDNIAAIIGGKVCASIPDNTTRKVFIYDPVTFGNLALVSGFLTQMKIITAALQSFVDIPPGTVPDAGVAKQIQDLQAQVAKLQAQVADLQTKGAPAQNRIGPGLVDAEGILQALGPYISASTTDKNTNFTLSDAAIAMNVTHYLTTICRTKLQVIYPRIGLPVDTMAGGPAASQMLQNIFATLFTLQRQAAALTQAGEDKYLPAPAISEQTTTTASPTTTKSTTPATQVQIPKTLAGLDYQSLSGASGLLNQILAYYTQPLPGGAVPAVASLAQGYQLLQELAKPDGTILFMEGTTAGGTQRIRKNLVTNLFTGDWIRYSGGAVIAFGILDLASGEIFPADTYRFLTPYTTIKNTSKAKAKAASAGDNLGR